MDEERLQESIADYLKALAYLEKAAALPKDEFVRDARYCRLRSNKRSTIHLRMGCRTDGCRQGSKGKKVGDGIRDRLSSRYGEIPTDKLLERVLSTPQQIDLPLLMV
jgi:hypothetical protein